MWTSRTRRPIWGCCGLVALQDRAMQGRHSGSFLSVDDDLILKTLQGTGERRDGQSNSRSCADQGPFLRSSYVCQAKFMSDLGYRKASRLFPDRDPQSWFLGKIGWLPQNPFGTFPPSTKHRLLFWVSTWPHVSKIQV